MTKFIVFISLIFTTIDASAQPKFNKELSALLDTIYQEDQSSRHKIDSLQRKFGWQSEQVQSLLRPMMIQDSINLIKVKNIIDTYGWLGPEEVGKQGAKTIFFGDTTRRFIDTGKLLSYNARGCEERKCSTPRVSLTGRQDTNKPGKRTDIWKPGKNQ